MALTAPVIALSPAVIRRAAMLLGSLLFYAFWRVDFTFLVVFSAMVDFIAARSIYTTTNQTTKRFWLCASLLTNLGLLAVFKYTYFILGTTQGVLGWVGLDIQLELPRIILPLGISFYTFQTISYTIDVYRGVQVPVRQFGLFLTYVMFWPQLVAGPILRAHEVIPQFEHYQRPRIGDVVHGCEEVLRGLFKKVVLADSIAMVVDYGFGLPADALATLDVWTLSFAFGMQIYFDFSGYSQIAIGSARIMGMHFPANFNWPYLAVSPRDFWKRWHISLSAWIRDYLYLPLQGARFRGASTGGIEIEPAQQTTEARRNIALLATWLIMGLWHGANWTFVLWGAWHAAFILIYRLTGPLFKRLPNAVRTVLGWSWTIGVVMLGWVFFRAQSVGDAMTMISTALNPTQLSQLNLRENHYLVTFVFFSGLLMVAGVLKLSKHCPNHLGFDVFRYAVLAATNAVMIFLVFVMLRQLNQFIYFQF